MKRTLQQKKLDQLLHSSQIVHGGMMGEDQRTFEEVIEADLAVIEQLDYTKEAIGQRMAELTELAIPSFGNWFSVNDNLRVYVDDYKGRLICPWPHKGVFCKRLTYAQRTDLDKTIVWTELGAHMILEHGFFEGKGSVFRLEPEDLISIIM